MSARCVAPSSKRTNALATFMVSSMGLASLGRTAIGKSKTAMMTASQLVRAPGDLAARIKQWINLESVNPTGAAAAAGPARSTLSQRPSLPTQYDAPRDETEQRIARVWEDALGINELGINDDFSKLGGHSLIAIRIVSELRKAFQIDLPVRALFDAPTIAELSLYIQEHLIAEIDALTEEEARQLVSNA